MKKELQSRLIDFTAEVIGISKSLKQDFTGQHLGKQIIRSSSSSSLNYGEAQHAESRNDFVHKMSLVLKELRETQINLELIQKSRITNKEDAIKNLVQECNELIAIFYKSIQTAKNNNS
jgi:four helix bundle protein